MVTTFRISLVCLLAGLVFESCTKINPVNSPPASGAEYSNISIGLSMQGAPSAVVKIVGILSRSGYDTVTRNFAISNDSASCEFPDVLVGTWRLAVNAYDSANVLKYSGSTDVQVLGGQTTNVNLVLNPATGSILVTVTWQASAANLIQNPYFEQNGSPSLRSWAINNATWVNVVPGVPPDNPGFALWLAQSAGPTAGGMAKTYITGLTGVAPYTLSFWERNPSRIAWGLVYLAQIRAGTHIRSKFINASDSVWTSFSLTDTLSLLPSDSIEVTLWNESLIFKSRHAAVADSIASGVLYSGISLTKDK